MIMSDIGVETSEFICEQLRKRVKERGITDPKEITGLIQEIIAEIMGDDTGLDLSVSPSVIMVIGVNGAGKTTTIGKLCHQFKNEGKKVLVAAADTFRAAAIDQLQVWTDRAGVDIVKHAEGSDPGAVVYDALEAAKARNCDIVIIDTAGRLHNKKNLMEELKKINRIISNKAPDSSREILLVLDATTGQNAVSQAKLFGETAPITGIVLTKLDGTAKGGIVISIKNELGIPVKLIGVGEKIDDLQPFDSHMFVDALFDGQYEEESEEETEETAESAEEIAETDEEDLDYESSEDIDDDEIENPVSEPDAEPETVSEEIVSEVEDLDAGEFEEPQEFGRTPAEEPEDIENVSETESEEDVSESENVPTETISLDIGSKDISSAEEEFADTFDFDREVEVRTDYTFNEDFMKSFDNAEKTEEKEEETESPKKKKGFFSRLFGKKDKDDNNDE